MGFNNSNLKNVLQSITINSKCLVIGDGTIGMQNQSMALAIAIGLKPQLVEIKPKWFPRIFPVLFAGRFGILLSDKDNFLLSSDNQIVITCGRRMIGINIGIKRLAKKKSINSLNIQIQSPKKFVPYFDILISPEHDKLIGPNVISTFGSLNQVTKQNIYRAFQKLDPSFSKKCVNHISIMIGGNSKNQRVRKIALKELIAEILRIKIVLGCNIVISTSRRTPNYFKTMLQKFSNENNFLFCNSGSDTTNPYPGILHNAKAIIVTTDSVNMISEAISSGLPVFGFNLYKPRSRKALFIKQLIQKNYLKMSFDLISLEDLNKTEDFIENETNRIGRKIKNLLVN